MPTALNFNDILTKVKKLDKEEQLTLLQRLVAIIRKNNNAGSPVKLSKISGIGAKVWKKTDIDGYIEQERQW